MRAVRLGEVKRVIAYRDFDRKFRFMAGEFRPEAYYAECVDLLRKLAMTGALGLIPPGTVFQGYCSVMFSLTFMVIHVKLWPYPSMSANLLKLFTDLQVYLVTLTGLILKINSGAQERISRGFGWTGSLYSDLMWLLLVLTAVPTAFALLYKTPVEKLQYFLYRAARADLDDEASTVVQRRQTLRRRRKNGNSSVDGRSAAVHVVAGGGIASRAVGAAHSLPSEWVERTHEGRPYYINTRTHERTWTPPPNVVGPADASSTSRGASAAKRRNQDKHGEIEENPLFASPLDTPGRGQAHSEWVPRRDLASGRQYYANTRTRETTWVHPGRERIMDEVIEEAEV